MKKLFVMSLIVLGAAPAFAKVSSTAIVASQFNWRGLNLNNGAAVQGMTTYTHETTGLTGGAFLSNQDTFYYGNNNQTGANPLTHHSHYLFNPFFAWGMPMGDIGLSFMAMYFNFSPSSSQNNGMEYTLGATWMGAKLSLSYMPRSVQSIGFSGGTEYVSSDMYLNLSYKAALDDKLALFVAFGNRMFDKGHNIGITSYSDYKLALQHTVGDTTFEMGYTNTIGLQTYATPTVESSTKKDVDYTAQQYVSLTKAF